MAGEAPPRCWAALLHHDLTFAAKSELSPLARLAGVVTARAVRAVVAEGMGVEAAQGRGWKAIKEEHPEHALVQGCAGAAEGEERQRLLATMLGLGVQAGDNESNATRLSLLMSRQLQCLALEMNLVPAHVAKLVPPIAMGAGMRAAGLGRGSRYEDSAAAQHAGACVLDTWMSGAVGDAEGVRKKWPEHEREADGVVVEVYERGGLRKGEAEGEGGMRWEEAGDGEVALVIAHEGKKRYVPGY
jgi:hypothetical protein